MNSKWKQATKEIRALGIHLNTSYTECCLGCIPAEKIKHPEDAPAIYQLRSRWSSDYGGYLCHSNLSDSHKLGIMAILGNCDIDFSWDGQSHHTIRITLGDNE